MKMFAFRLTDKNQELKCEECTNENCTVWGMVSQKEILDHQDGPEGRREAAEDLLWNFAKGQILCKSCIKKKVKR
jgi:hypothetical protein